MKMFKTEKTILFNSKNFPKEEAIKTKNIPKESKMKILSETNVNLIKNKFLGKKIHRFIVAKSDEIQQKNIVKEGRWNPEEQTRFIHGIVKYGIKWKEISSLIDTRTPNQIRSHAQKVFKKLKRRKDRQLGIDFTSKSITNFNDMINHVKSVNNEYNIEKIFLYMINKSEPNSPNKNINKIIINKNNKNILNKDLNKLNINNDTYNNNDKNIIDVKNNIINNEININIPNYNISTNIINNINNLPINDLLITNQNLINTIYNQLNILFDDYIKNLIATNIINNANNNNILNYFLNYYNNIYTNLIQANLNHNHIPFNNQKSSMSIISTNND